MTGLHSRIRGRTFLAGKIIFNFGKSSIDCTVRRLSDDGATLELESGLGVPERFQLAVVGESEALRAWRQRRSPALPPGVSRK